LEKQSTKSFLLVHALDGYDEISLTGQFLVVGNSFEALYEPEDLGFKKVRSENIKGAASHQEAAQLLEAILSGNGTCDQESVVVVNAAFALLVADQAEGDIFDKLKLARIALESGASLRLLRQMQTCS
jgi:anthranilate phosphoribosyltransferase